MQIDTALNCKPPQGPQLEFIKQIFRDCPGIAITHFVGGRGSGKTKQGVLALAKSAFEINAGLRHLWTEPTNDDCLSTFLPTWQDTIPDSLYKVRLSPRIKITTVNGSEIEIKSRQAKNSKWEPGRGPNYAAIFFDELAQDPMNKGWVHMVASCREPRSKKLMVVTMSTPKLGWYKDVVCDGTGEVIYGTSFDNPYTNHDAIEIIKKQYSPRLLEQEIYAKWIALSKLAWEEADLTKEWPDGNLHRNRWDPTLPYVLSIDIGVQSGALIIQRDPMDGVDVAVAEFTRNDGNTEKLAREINTIYGQPNFVIVGADLNTRDVNTGITAATVMQRSVGWTCPIKPVVGLYADKNMQHAAGCCTLLNGAGHRQFCVSTGLRTHSKQSPERGIVAVLTQDTWAEIPRQGEFLPKDKRDKRGSALEDIRDAFQYWAVITHTPRSYEQIGSMLRAS